MNVAVVGRRGEGKSTLSLWLARNAAGKGVVVFDPRALYTGVRVSDGSELEGAILDRAWEDGPLCYTPDGDVESAFQEMSEVLFPPRFTRTNFALIVDEAGQLQSAHACHPALMRAIAQHPPDRVTIIQNTHRMAEFHGKLKSLMDDLFIFCTVYGRDLEAIFDYTENEEVTEKVKTLPLHHAIHFSYRRNTGEQWKMLDNPAEWYTPLHIAENQPASAGRS